ncbi:MAG: heparinase II/III domain-containing protein, partial [Spirochaetota bacterium]
LPGDTASLYYYARGRLMELALTAVVTRDHGYVEAYETVVDDLATRDLDFWIGPDYPNRPRFQVYEGTRRYTGELETAALASGLAISFDWIRRLLPHPTRERIHGLLLGTAYPLLRNSTLFQSERWVMNHLCVIASALTLVAFTVEGIRADVERAGGDAPVLFPAADAERIARDGIPIDEDVDLVSRALGSWMATIDADGSYGEGFHYWAYPVNCLSFALEALANVREVELPEMDCLARSLEWAIYNQIGLYDHPEFDRPVAISVNTYDCPYAFQMEAPEVLLYLRRFASPLAAWYVDRYLLPDPPRPDALHTAFHECPAALIALDDRGVEPRSPAELCLPPSRVFHDTGFVYLRDGWDGLASEAGDTVLALASGGGGRANSHQHLDKNSISLFSRGEYWIVDPGHSCYRGETHAAYDRRTYAHNTLCFDGADQDLAFVEMGMKPEERKPIISHHNRAEVIGKRHYRFFDYVASDGRRCYEPWLDAFTRRVWFVRDDYFVIWDRVDAGDHPGTPSLGFNLNNRDGALTVELNGGVEAPGGADAVALALRASRPHSDLSVQVLTPVGTELAFSDGRLHLAYQVIPGAPVEGAEGTARRVDLVMPGTPRAFDLVWLVAPLDTGESAPVVRPGTVPDGDVCAFEVDFRGRTVTMVVGERSILRFPGGAEYTV